MLGDSSPGLVWGELTPGRRARPRVRWVRGLPWSLSQQEGREPRGRAAGDAQQPGKGACQVNTASPRGPSRPSLGHHSPLTSTLPLPTFFVFHFYAFIGLFFSCNLVALIFLFVYVFLRYLLTRPVLPSARSFLIFFFFLSTVHVLQACMYHVCVIICYSESCQYYKGGERTCRPPRRQYESSIYYYTQKYIVITLYNK